MLSQVIRKRGLNMPKYDFECVRCLKKEERNVLYEKRDHQFCKCGGKMNRLFSPQGTVFQVRWGKPKVRDKVRKMGA